MGSSINHGFLDSVVESVIPTCQRDTDALFMAGNVTHKACMIRNSKLVFLDFN